MKHILTFSLLLFTLSLHAAFTRLATETYPGGGGVATNAVAGITTNGVPVALDAAKIAHLIIPEGGGPTGGVTKAYVDAHDLATLFASTNYTDDATNALDLAHLAALAATAQSATNYTDAATNALDVSHQSQMSQLSQASTNFTLAVSNVLMGALCATNDELRLAISAESTARLDGDTALQTALEAESARAVGAEDALTTSLANEADDRAAGDTATITAAKIYADRMGAADWNATTSYAKGNFVWYTDETTPENTGLYVASKPGTNLPPPLNPDYWTKMPDANALFSQSNAQLSKNFLPWKGGSNAYVEWSGQNVRVYNGGLFARTLDLQAGFSNLKAYEGTSPYTSLPDYLRGATWNTAADPFAKKSDVDASTLTATNWANANFAKLINNGSATEIGKNGFYISDEGSAGVEIRLNNGDEYIGYFFPWLDYRYSGVSHNAGYVLTDETIKDYYPAITNSYPFALGNMVSNTVSQWEGYWNGSNVYWSVTNYLEAGNAKIMRLYEIQTNGVHREIWNDSDKYDIFFTNTLDAVASTNTFTREWVGTFVTNSLDAKADRAWGKYTSAGYDVPDTNMVWHTAPTTVFAGGFEFQKVAVAGGEIGVLVSQGAVPYAAGAEGKFIIGDGFGTNYFGYVKKDDYIIACGIDDIEAEEATKMVTLKYDLVFSGEYPIVYYSPTVIPVTAQTWIQLNKSDGTLTPGAPWPVTFSTGAGYIKAHISFASATPEMPPDGFFTSSTAVIGGGTFKTNMKADFLDAGIMCTNTDTKVMGVIRPTFDGTTVHWNWSKQ